MSDEPIELDRHRAETWRTSAVVCSECGWMYVAVRQDGTIDRCPCARCNALALVAVEAEVTDEFAVYHQPNRQPEMKPTNGGVDGR